MHALVLLNPSAGSLNGDRGVVTPDELGSAFAAEGCSVEVRTPEPAAFAEAVAAAVEQRPAALFVGGGDGTLSLAAHALAGTGIPLGVLPLGTFNHFARDLGVPPAWRDAVAALSHGSPRQVDLGEVNGRSFINNCSIGSYAEAVRKREALRRVQGSGKAWAMIVATLAVFRELRRRRLRIAIGDTTTALRTPFVVVANNRYSGRVLDYSLRPQLDAGELWIYTTRARRHGEILRLIAQSLVRDIDDVHGLEQRAAQSAVIDAETLPLPIALDGELVALKPPLHFRIRRGALAVWAPHQAVLAA